MLSIYHSLIQSHLNYCLIIWGSADKTILQPLLILQNKFLRLLTNSERRSHAPPLFRENKLLNIFDLYQLNILKFAWNTLNNSDSFPSFLFKHYFIRNSQIHQHHTRQNNNIHPQKFKLEYGKKSVQNQCRILWNEAPNTIKQSKCISQLKSRTTKLLLSKYL